MRRRMQKTYDMRSSVGSFARPQSAVPRNRIPYRRRIPDQLECVAVQRFRCVVRVAVVRQVFLGAGSGALQAGQPNLRILPETNALLTSPFLHSHVPNYT